MPPVSSSLCFLTSPESQLSRFTFEACSLFYVYDTNCWVNILFVSSSLLSNCQKRLCLTQVKIFWVSTLCSIALEYQHFRGPGNINLQGDLNIHHHENSLYLNFVSEFVPVVTKTLFYVHVITTVIFQNVGYYGTARVHQILCETWEDTHRSLWNFKSEFEETLSNIRISQWFPWLEKGRIATKEDQYVSCSLSLCTKDTIIHMCGNVTVTNN